MTVPPAGPPAPRRRREVVAGAAVAVAVAVLVAVVGLTGDPGDDDPPAAATTSTAASPSAPAPGAGTGAPEAPVPAVATGPTGAADQPPTALPAVDLDEEATGGEGVRARVVGLEAVTGSGEGRGSIAGPALRATVQLVNGSPDPVALDLVVVNLTHGADATPAPPLRDSSAVPFSGQLAPGETAEAVFLYTVPADDRGAVTLTVGYRAGAPLLTFSGPVD
jgi:hypothetical protein